MKRQLAKRKGRPNQSAAPYLTKRVIKSASRSAAIAASDMAMKIAGFVIKAENGWIVRENRDGSTKKIKRIGNSKSRLAKIVLD